MKIYLMIMIFCINFNSVYMAKGRINNCISPVDEFTGRRDEIKELTQKLNTHNAVVIYGIGGVGKTQIVREYVRLHELEYEKIWWYDGANDLISQSRDFAETINAMYPKANISTSEENVVRDLNEFIKTSKYANQKTLIIYDNVDNLEAVKDHLINYSNNTKIIFTSRELIIGYKSILLNFLNREDSRTLIKAIILDHKEEDSDLLFKRIGGYPLGLEQAAAFLKQNSWIHAKEYIELLNTEEKNLFLDSRYKKDQKNEYKFSMFLPIKATVKKIKETSEDTYNLLLYISYMYADGIDISVIKDIYKVKSEKFLEYKYINSINTLLNFSLMRLVTDKHTKNKYFIMNDFIQEVVLSEVANQNKNIINISEIASSLIRGIPKDIKLENFSWIGSVNLPEMFEPNIIKILKYAKENAIFSEDIFILKVTLLRIYLSDLRYNLVEKLIDEMQQDINKYNIISDDGKIAECAYYYILGIFYDYQYSDLTKNMLYFKKAEKIMQKVSKKNELKLTIDIMISSAAIWGGDLQTARRYLDSFFEKFEDYQDPSWQIISLGYFIKAKVLMEEGAYSLALKAINMSVDEYKVSKENVDTLPIYLLKSEILRKLGKNEEAYGIMKQTYEQVNSVVDNDNELMGRVLSQLSAVEKNLNKNVQALNHIDKVISIIKKIHESGAEKSVIQKDDNLAFAYEIKGDILYNNKQYEESLNLYIKAHDILKYRYEDKYEIDSLGGLIIKIIVVARINKHQFIMKHYKNLYDNYFSVNNEIYQKEVILRIKDER